MQVYAPHEYLFRSGDLSTAMYIVQKGLASRLGRVSSTRIYGPKAYFGEDCLQRGSRRLHHVMALTYVTVFVIHQVCTRPGAPLRACASMRGNVRAPQEALYGVLEKGNFPTIMANVRLYAIKASFRSAMSTILRNYRYNGSGGR